MVILACLPRQKILALACLMEENLRKNANKDIMKKFGTDSHYVTVTYDGWDKDHCSNEYLVSKFLEESAELIASVISGATAATKDVLVKEFDHQLSLCFGFEGTKIIHQTKKEAADVANVSMMLADNNGGLEP